MVAGLLAAVVAGLIVFGRRRTPAPVASETKPAFETFAPPRPVQSSWLATPLQFEPGARLERVKHDGRFYYACGMSSVAGLTPARVWRSDNGIEWFPLGTMEPGLVTDVAFLPSPMAFGHVVGLQAQPVAACWVYKDEESGWTRITGLHATELDGVLFEQAESASEGFVAGARARAGTGLYLSSNGAMWNPSRFPIAVEAIQRVGKNLVVFGRHRDDRRIEILESADGVDWAPWPEPSTLPFEMSHVESVVPLLGGFVAGGADRLRHMGAIWVSDDGRVWHRVSVEFPAESHVAWLGVVGDEPCAVVETMPSGGVPTLELWQSSDAVQWSAVENSRIEGAVFLGAFLRAGQVEVFGRATTGGNDEPLRRWSIEVAAAPAAVTPPARR